MAYHKLLERQLKKHLPDQASPDPSWHGFLQAISDSYQSFDRDRELAEHAFRISEDEYSAINARLKDEISLKHQSIVRLKEMLVKLVREDTSLLNEQSDDLLEIVDLIVREIKKREAAEAELIQAKLAAEKASHSKSEFLSIMSHEIRTPLNAIIGMGHLLIHGNPRPDQENNLRALKSSADHLLLLINDILDFNKMEAGKIELEKQTVQLKQQMQELVNTFQPYARERGNTLQLQYDVQVPEFVFTDALRLNQVLHNLLSNAIKFTTGGTVLLSVTHVGGDNKQCRICFAVSDTGIGIDPSQLHFIFDPFKQASSSITRQFGGTGLGLAISKRILQLFNSKMEVVSTPGTGSAFSFSMDVMASDQPLTATYPHAPEATDLQQAHILLVEDTEFNVLFATQLLEGWNARVSVASNGAEAVAFMQSHSVQLILMDLQMPVMDGYTAAQAIRAFDSQVPILALTASASEDVKEKVLAAGMQGHISKPFNPDEFYQRLKRYL